MDNQRQLSGLVKACESIFDMYQALIPRRVCDYGSLDIDADEEGELPSYYTNHIECFANATQGDWQVTDLKANQKVDPNTGREIIIFP